MNNILVISAHPDDMEIGMGGTIAKAVENGAAVTSIILTDGRRGPNPFSMSEEEVAAMRKKEAQEAGKILGVTRVVAFDLPDLKNDHYDQAASRLRQILEDIQPDEVFTLHPKLDRHLTHRLAGQLMVDLTKQKKTSTTVWAYEVWGLFSSWDRAEDISGQIGKKIKAIGAHKSQISAIPFDEGIMGLNRWRAVFSDPGESGSNFKFQEVFIRIVPRKRRAVFTPREQD